MPRYVGQYHSAVSSLTGCIKEFVSTKTDTMNFPPQVLYFCDLCNTTHPFRFTKSIIVHTPSQQKQLEAFCKSHHIERDVDVSVKK